MSGERTFVRNTGHGASQTATVREVPGQPGYIEVRTDFALSLLADAGRDGVVAESLPGVVMFTVTDLTDLLSHVGWVAVDPKPRDGLDALLDDYDPTPGLIARGVISDPDEHDPEGRRA